MSLLLHRATRSDRLADALADLLADPLPDPFADELVLVPARGVERWLSQRLSHRLGPAEGRDDGVCAGVTFRSPQSLVAEVTGVGPGASEVDPWSPDALVWPLLAVVDAHLDAPWCRTLALHLGHAQPGEEGELRRGRRYAVARRLARLFASYAVQRPALLVDWEAGRDTNGAGGRLAEDLLWQAELWRRLVAHVGEPTPVERQAAVVAALLAGPTAADLPERFSLFGHTRIASTEAELLAALGAHRDVHLWLPHPSPALWAALRGVEGATLRVEDRAHERVGHPLLVSLGRDLRELERTLGPVGSDHEVAVPAAPGDDLLSWLQDDLAANALPVAPRTLAEGDRSIQVHACHGPARQVEVLREVLLGLLADDTSLEPRDILVMCPDIEAYAPLVEAAFGLGEVAGGHPGQRLQVRLADRSLTQTNPLLAVVGKLLDLAGGRAGASEVLDLLEAPPVRRRFGFADRDLETIATWVEQSGIRWAYDEEHRADYALAEFVQNTWRFGLDRVLAGVAMSDDAERWIGATLPLDDVGSTSIDLAGRLAELLDRLASITDRLTGSHPVDHWLETLREGVEALSDVAPADAWQLGQVRRELAGLSDDVSRQDGELALRLPDVRALMAERLAGRPTRANFRTGTLTVCTMVPMRSVPHRVVCLLGLDDGVFPRSVVADGDDVLARDPMTGERDPRSEDRQLLLDAVMSATEHLVVTYSGAHETTGQPRPPAVPLGELLDSLDDTAAGAARHVVRHHPLQPFATANLEAETPFSFDRAALLSARAAAGPRTEPPRICDLRLPPRPEGDVDLADLLGFLKAPVRTFLRSRLDVALPYAEDPLPDGLPVELDGLQEWHVGERILADLRHGRPPELARAKEWRRGVLPPGRLGWRKAAHVLGEAEPVAELADAFAQSVDPRAVDVDVDLGGGRRLRGTVTDVFGDRVVKVGYSRLGPKHWLEAWLPLLALCATSGRDWSAGSVGRGAKGKPPQRVAWARVEGAGDMLRDLVALYDAGLCEPLPLPLKTAHAWAVERKNKPYWRARRAADQWESSYDWDKENAEPAHVAVYGKGFTFAELNQGPPHPGEEHPGETTRLGALAMRMWMPMIERRSGG